MALQTPNNSNFIKEAGDVIAIIVLIVMYVFGNPLVKKLLSRKSGIDTDEQRRVLLSVASDYQMENKILEAENDNLRNENNDQKQALEAAQATIREQAETILELRRRLDKYIQD